MNLDLVSVIMPVYNVANHLERSIKYIQNQTYTDWELILINDGSEDTSGEICSFFAKQDKRIKLYDQENKGTGLARQNGLERAQGEYICFVDPDDYLEVEALERNVKIMRKYKVQMVANSYYILSKYDKDKTKKKKRTSTLEGYYTRNEFRENYEEYRKIGDRTVWSKLYRRDLIIESKIRFTNLPVGQDALFNYEVYKELDNIYVDRRAFYVYDSTRDNSAVKIYRSNRLDYELQIISGLAKLFEEWNMVLCQENGHFKFRVFR